MEGSSSDSHPIFHRDPANYMQYVYKEVRIEVKDGTSHTGRLYTVDPVSESMVLARMNNGMLTGLELIMGHAIKGIIVLDEDTEVWRHELDALFKFDMHTNMTKEELKKRKKKLKCWLLKNLLPIEESTERPDVLSLSDALFIEPPYGPENCCSTNEIILGRVQGLIKSMPKDLDDW
ncbi:hypothetical protein LSH36_10g11077 [Paralvinella palmiformis]|uniref:AD domain-containing protein n=1 Tax=Paralvinella palmiformis TaxID=53620 RepID=A0AAD9KER7_9ANNE|nr:hypothetical protein LSH36_10g11077 [Paralvinella palmiformis]